MTPEEKAIELVEKYRDAQYGGCMMCDEYEEKLESAKQCALIAVDEIMVYYPVANDDENSQLFHNYWNEVKSEINQL